ncbi:restriction endonuclease subunit S [Vibrio vulnificus]|nr:restriction endonuclease subunit S [Vibrio vulnificus]ELQ2456180.1 restriction endonuclease subunit S [Vibrio vulnificus]
MSNSVLEFVWETMISVDSLVVSDQVKLGRGEIISKEDIRDLPGPYPIYSSSSKSQGKMGQYGKFMFDEELITWSVDGGGFVFYRPKHKFSVTNVCGYMQLSEQWDYRFVSYLLQLQHSYLSFDYQSKAHPSVIRNLYYLPKVDIGIQRKIAEILATIDNQIDATQALIDKYTAIKQGMMADLFSRGIDPETKALRPTFEEASELYHKTPLGMLPKGWKVIELENLLDEVTSPMRSGPFGSALLKEELVSEGIPLLGIDNIFVERFKASYKRFVTERKFRELSRYAVRERDVVITIMGTVGRSCVIPESIGLALSSKHLWTMTFDKEQILPELVCWQLNHSPWAESWFRRESQGGVMDAIQSQTLKKLKLVVPPPVEQNAIYERYKNLNNHIEVNQTSLDKLKLQKTGLMQDLLTGKVPVPA